MSKTRVTPTKPITIPTLELQAALLGLRLAGAILNEFELRVTERVFWSDSTTVLHWIRSEPYTKQTFIANRLGAISESTRISEWRWVPMDLNPADDATRASNKYLNASDCWFTGPEFLIRPLEKSEIREYNNLESRREFVLSICANAVEFPVRVKLLGWNGLLVAAVRLKLRSSRWLEYWHKIKKKKFSETRVNRSGKGKEGQGLRDELIEAAKYWYQEIQSASVPSELQALKLGGNIRKGSKLRDLNRYIDNEGILRTRGRVSKLKPHRFENHPIILNASHFATKTLIAEHHHNFKHASNDTIANELRQEFFIIGLRTHLRWIAKRCIVCRLGRAKPQNPPMAYLPKCQVAYKFQPFSHCGVDYFGPIFVKIGRRREKRWGVLFTCMSTRAIHLELASTLEASSTIMALRRLESRRGYPVAIYSDNATNFKKASKELQDAILNIDESKQISFAATKTFSWHFNPPHAPHMGGAWERLICSVKTALFHVLHDQAPTEEVLLTVLVEIEHMINSRPLTHVSIDSRDEEALTPNHFLISSSSGNLCLQRYDTESFTPRKQFELAQQFADSFWKWCLKEYLPTLLPRRKWIETNLPLEIGDIVIIADDQAPRNVWRKDRVVKLCPGSDGIVRVAKICTKCGEFTRPVHKFLKIFRVNEVENV